MKVKKDFKTSTAILGCLLGEVLTTSVFGSPTTKDLESMIDRSSWNEANEIAYELFLKDSHNPIPKLKGAYSLFQKGYSNAALSFLKRLSIQDWKKISEKDKNIAEMAALFQKKVPFNLVPGRLEQLNENSAHPILKDEIRFAKGRQAFESSKWLEAKNLLSSISQSSRYYGQAHYLLAVIAVKQSDPEGAKAEFSKIFEPAVFAQGSEFWSDLSSAWGNAFRVLIDANSLSEAAKLSELAVLGMARVAYSKQRYEEALSYYGKIKKGSTFYARATLESIWTLWALGRHEEAQKVALDLSANESSFEAVEAKIARALVLVDIGKTTEAREQLESFYKSYETFKVRLRDYQGSRVASILPNFVVDDLKTDKRISLLDSYKASLQQEMDSLAKEDSLIFPVYLAFRKELLPLVSQTSDLQSKYILEHVKKREKDLDWLLVQSRLITAESYLEDREKLREEVKGGVSEEKQRELDRRLVELLEKAVGEGENIIKKFHIKNVALEFRQSELYWELGSAKAMVGLTSQDEKLKSEADSIRLKALRTTEDLLTKYPKFERYGQLLFFVGFAQIELDEIDKGYSTLKRFANLYPNDQHAADAYRMLADVEFDRNRFRQAIEYYKRVLTFQNSPVLGYAFYKLGWSAYNLKDFTTALASLEQACLWVNQKQNLNQLSLRREARHDLISFYAEIGDHRKAYEYFGRFAKGDDLRPWIVDLANELHRIGQYDRSIDLFRALILTSSDQSESADFHAKIISGAFNLRKFEVILDSAKSLSQNFKSFLETPTDKKESISFQVEESLRQAVLGQLFEWKKTNSDQLALVVFELNKSYLEIFANWPSSQDVLYRHALFLNERKQEKLAAATFEEHWNKFSNILEEPLKEEAIRNLIVSLQEKSNDKSLADKKGENDDKLVNYAKEYLLLYPATEHSRKIEFLAATTLLRDPEKLDEGLKATEKVFLDNTADEIGKQAFSNLRTKYYSTKDWERILDWATRLLTKKTPYTKDLNSIREETGFLLAEQIKDSKDAAETYLKIATTQTSTRLRNKSYYNAFVLFEKSGQKLKAIEVANELEKIAPESEETQNAAGVLAALYQEAGDYENALPRLKRFLAKPPKEISSDVLSQAYFNAALMEEGLGNKSQAVAYYQKASGKPESKTALERINSKPEVRLGFPKWASMMRTFQEYFQKPLPPVKDLAGQIRLGAQKLEATVKLFVDTASDVKVPAHYALESYCAVPFLYDSYVKAVLDIPHARKIASNEVAELLVELKKIVAPIEATVIETANTCIAKAEASEHDGDFFRRVGETWGWQQNKVLKQKADSLLSKLDLVYPFIDQVDLDENENQILVKHHRGDGDEETWYKLALLRYKRKKTLLARLTVLDAISKGFKSGELINLLSICTEKAQTTASFEAAARAGSKSAYANLGYLHLRGARLDSAKKAFREAASTNVLGNEELVNAVEGVLE
ncbi:MAG: tetratricopeptide repeat protein [Bacteriovoracia bacterium]